MSARIWQYLRREERQTLDIVLVEERLVKALILQHLDDVLQQVGE